LDKTNFEQRPTSDRRECAVHSFASPEDVLTQPRCSIVAVKSPRLENRGSRSLSFAGPLEWAMLGSNQRPLPCEVTIVFTAGCRCLRKIRINKANQPPKSRLLLRCVPSFYAWVAARLLHRYCYWRASEIRREEPLHVRPMNGARCKARSPVTSSSPARQATSRRASPPSPASLRLGVAAPILALGV
jgi:hypothetical protein